MTSNNIDKKNDYFIFNQVIKIVAYTLLLWVLTNLISSIIIKLIIEKNHIFEVFLYFMYGSIISIPAFVLLGFITFFFIFLFINKWWLVLASVSLTLCTWFNINNCDLYSLIDKTPIVYSIVISILTIVFTHYIVFDPLNNKPKEMGEVGVKYEED